MTARFRAVIQPRIQAGNLKSSDRPEWWDADRWDEELAATLADAITANATAAAKSALSKLGIDPDAYDEPRTRAYLESWAESYAGAINNSTLSRLKAAIDGELEDDAQGSTPEGVFGMLAETYAFTQGATMAVQTANWGKTEAARQQGGSWVKTWRHNPSKDPRARHARMDGETVPLDAKFSNGARYPGDIKNLKASEVANCRCTLEVKRADHPAISSGDVSWSSKSFGRHANKHAGEFGLDVTKRTDRDRYREIANEVIDDADAVAYNKWAGQDGECAFYFRGDDLVIVNVDKREIVSLMKFEEGRNARLTEIRNSVRE